MSYSYLSLKNFSGLSFFWRIKPVTLLRAVIFQPKDAAQM